MPGEAAVPPAVALLRAAGIPPGPETAYSVALRTGFVPTVGAPSEHPLYARPMTAAIPMTGFAVPRQAGPAVPGTVIVQPEQTAALPAGQQAVPESIAHPATQQSGPPAAGPPPVAEQVPQAGSVPPGQQVQVPGRQEAAQCGQDSPAEPNQVRAQDGGGAGIKPDAAPDGTTGVTAHGDQPLPPGVASGGPGAGRGRRPCQASLRPGRGGRAAVTAGMWPSTTGHCTLDPAPRGSRRRWSCLPGPRRCLTGPASCSRSCCRTGSANRQPK